MSSGVRHIAMLAFPHAQMLDVVGPLEVFAAANAIRSAEGAAPLYTVGIVAPAAGSFETASGLPLTATAGIERLHDGIDTLLVAGGEGGAAARRKPPLGSAGRRGGKGGGC